MFTHMTNPINVKNLLGSAVTFGSLFRIYKVSNENRQSDILIRGTS